MRSQLARPYQMATFNLNMQHVSIVEFFLVIRVIYEDESISNKYHCITIELATYSFRFIRKFCDHFK